MFINLYNSIVYYGTATKFPPKNIFICSLYYSLPLLDTGARQAAVQQALASTLGEALPMSERRFTGPIPQVLSPSASDYEMNRTPRSAVSGRAEIGVTLTPYYIDGL